MIDIFLGRIIVCFILSFFVGLERQLRRRVTGLRTNVLVSLGSFLFVSLAANTNITGDVTRIAAQVVSGIGFLGAGVILKDGTHIKGLNTAATLWCNAAIGVLCAHGLLIEAIIGTFFILSSNILLRYLGIKIFNSSIQNDNNYLLTIVCNEKYSTDYRKLIVEWIEKTTILLEQISCEEIDSGRVKIKFSISARNSIEIEKMVNNLGIEKNIISVSWKMISEDYKKTLENDEE